MKKLLSIEALGMKAIVELQAAVRKFAKKEPVMYKAAPNLNEDTLSKAAELKAKMDILESQLKVLQEEYNPLRNQILDSLPGKDIDKVEVLINGVQLKKYPQVRGAGVFNQEKALKLVRKKKLLAAVTQKITIVNEDAFAVAVSKDLISQDEYASCLDEGNVSQVLKVERKFIVDVKPGNDEATAV